MQRKFMKICFKSILTWYLLISYMYFIDILVLYANECMLIVVVSHKPKNLNNETIATKSTYIIYI